MPMWRCPHCGTPQQEAARCWVCRRSSTTCSTCRHFRESLATSVGYCGLDPRRAPLRGTELKGCWTARTEALPIAFAESDPDPRPIPVAVARLRPDSRPTRPGVLEGFVPLELADRGPRVLQPSTQPPARRDASQPPDPGPAVPPPVGEVGEAWAERDSLFGDL